MQKISESFGTCVPGSLAKLTIVSGPRAIEQAQPNQRLKIIAKNRQNSEPLRTQRGG